MSFKLYANHVPTKAQDREGGGGGGEEGIHKRVNTVRMYIYHPQNSD